VSIKIIPGIKFREHQVVPHPDVVADETWHVSDLGITPLEPLEELEEECLLARNDQFDVHSISGACISAQLVDVIWLDADFVSKRWMTPA
jgi:hypothetical protein